MTAYVWAISGYAKHVAECLDKNMSVESGSESRKSVWRCGHNRKINILEFHARILQSDNGRVLTMSLRSLYINGIQIFSL